MVIGKDIQYSKLQYHILGTDGHSLVERPDSLMVSVVTTVKYVKS